MFKSISRLILLVGLVCAGLTFLFNIPGLTVETPQAREARADLAQLSEQERLLFSPDFENDYVMEGDRISAEEFWAHRVSYPTGKFDSRWVKASLAEDAQITKEVPDGYKNYARSSTSPLNLDPDSFTALGPKPLDMTGCQSCFDFGKSSGRINVIVSDPVDPTIAYAGSDGGGVWKTTTCCDSNTTWFPTMDDPALTTIAIGDLVLDPNDHETIYAGTGDLRFGSWSFGSVGVLKSEDGGATWTTLGADVFDAVYDQAAGVFTQYQAIGKVRVDPRDSDTLIVGTKQGVHFSYDGGANWTAPCLTNSFTTQRQDSTGMLVADNGTSTDLYVAIGTRGFNTTVQPDLDQNGANGIYKTTVPASGCPSSWTLVTTSTNGWPTGTGGGSPFPINQLGRIDLAMAPSDSDVIYAQIASSDAADRGLLGVWATDDGGSTWTQVGDKSSLGGCFGDWPQNWYDQGLAIDPNDPSNVFMSTVDLFRSTNNGVNFTNLTCGYAGERDVHVDHHALAFVGGSSDTLLVGTDGGLYVTTNANAASPNSVAFTNLNDSMNTIEFYSGDITANFATSANPGINGGAQDNGSMIKIWSTGDDVEAVWQGTTGGDGMYARIEPMQELRWYQSSQNGALKVSTTGPTGTYNSAVGPWGTNGDRFSFIMPYEIFRYDCPASGCTHMIAGGSMVYETIQGAVPASSWYTNSPDLTKGTLGTRSFIQELTYSYSNSSIAVVGTLDGNFWYGFDMGQGTTNSATWVNLTDSNSDLPNRPIMDVGTHPNNPLVGYAALGGFDENTPTTPGHVYRVTCSADCDTFSWVDKSGNLPNVPVNSIASNPNLPNQVFAGTDWGLYYTNDITANSPVWQKFTAGLPSVMIWDMAIDAGHTTLALFTRSRGAYAWPLPTSIPAAVTTNTIEQADDFSQTAMLAVIGLATLTLIGMGVAAKNRPNSQTSTSSI